MRKKKFAWSAVAVTLVAVIAIGAYYIFGGKDIKWQGPDLFN